MLFTSENVFCKVGWVEKISFNRSFSNHGWGKTNQFVNRNSSAAKMYNYVYSRLRNDKKLLVSKNMNSMENNCVGQYKFPLCICLLIFNETQNFLSNWQVIETLMKSRLLSSKIYWWIKTAIKDLNYNMKTVIKSIS